MKTQLCFFPGFYESSLDAMIDQEIEMEMDNKDLTYEDIEDQLDYNAARQAISKAWVNAFSQEIGIYFEFVELWSPREYNFTTDKVYAEISNEDIKKIYDKVHVTAEKQYVEAFDHILKSWFTPYDGFCPYYSNDVDQWNKNWDELNEIEASVYLAVEVIQHYDEQSFQKTLEDVSSVYEAADNVWIS